MQQKQVLIVSPAGAKENNGNWQTASRWAAFLRERYQVSIAASADYDAGAATSPSCVPAPDLFIALHARRSAAALATFASACPFHPRILILTGTDLYRDIHHDRAARAALDHATDLVLLQGAGVAVLPAGLRARIHVIHQSAPETQANRAARRVAHADAFRICMIGHLRPEKDPLTFIGASTLVHDRRIRLQHIGRALAPALGAAAAAAAAAAGAHADAASGACYEWLGDQPHATTRALLAGSHAMVICLLMEGGANVIIEALTSDVPVLASDINGNRGMLGEDYAGYFAPGDAAALAALMERCVADPVFYTHLQRQCRARAPLFAPAAERAAVLALAEGLLAAPPPAPLPPAMP